MLPPRRADGHKGTFGRVYLCGGCPGYTGAPVYAGEAAVRTGSGLVFVGVPEEVYPIAAARCRDAMVQPLPREDGALLERMAACDAALIGRRQRRRGSCTSWSGSRSRWYWTRTA